MRLSRQSAARGSGTGPRFVFVDGLRGVASLSVALLHTTGSVAQDISRALGAVVARGRLGVQIFFVISGFVIARNLMRSTLTSRSTTNFLWRRVLRLDPPYWASICLCLFVSKLASLALADHPFIAPRPSALVAHALYLQYILGIPSISDVYWTLCFEIQFYLLLAILVALTQRLEALGSRLAQYGVFVPTLILSGIVAVEWIAAPRGSCFAYWYQFLVGVAATWILLGRGSAFFYMALAVAVAVSAVSRSLDGLVVAMTGALIVTAYQFGSLETWLSDRFFQYLGKISYSLYLIHWTIGGHTANLLNRLIPGGPYVRLANALVGLGIAIFAADLFWRFVERPSILLSRPTPSPAIPSQPA